MASGGTASLETQVGSFIRHYRTLRGVSPADLSTSVGITQGLLGNIERGTASPSFAVAAEIFHRLGVDLQAVTSEMRRSQAIDDRLDQALAAAGMSQPDREQLRHMHITARERLLAIISDSVSS
jgi:transcriptional regulator with XRE-family HTH domain